MVDDNRKKGMLFMVIGIVVVFVGIIVALFMMSRKDKDELSEEVTQSVVSEVPDAESAEVPESKSEAYGQRRNNVIDSYWDEIGSETVGDDPLEELSASSQGSNKSGLTVDDLFPTQPQAAVQPQQPATPAYTREQRMADYQAQRQQIVNDVMAQQVAYNQINNTVPPPTAEEQKMMDDAANAALHAIGADEEEDHIDIDKVTVKRSGSVSSLGDGISSINGSGVSSLGGESDFVDTDEAYPFKCMFVRQEKLKSGSRVAVRLLEDMVIDGTLVPKNTHLMATCEINKRVQLNISNIDIGGRIVNLNYNAYDNDGTKGIYCSEINTRTKENAIDQSRQLGRNALRSNIGRIGQDLLQAGTVVLQRTGNEITVTIPEGYQFYIVKARN